MNKIQKYSFRLDESRTLVIHEEDCMHKRPCDIVTHRYNRIIALYNKDQNFAKVFVINAKIKLAYVISGNFDTILNLIDNEVMEISESIVAHELERNEDGDMRMREIYTEALIGEAIQREHAQMIIDKI